MGMKLRERLGALLATHMVASNRQGAVGKHRQVSRMASILLLLLLTTASFGGVAGTITIDKTTLDLPAPAPGFVILTPEMGRLYQLQKTLVIEANREFAVFMPEDVANRARHGELTPAQRFMRVQVAKEAEHIDLSPEDFKKLAQEVADSSVQESYVEALDDVKPQLDKHGKAASSLLESKVEVSIDNVTALKSEFASDRIMIIPARMGVEESINGGVVNRQVTMSTAFTLVKGKLLFLYVYGGADDLEWTKSVARTWAAELIRRNPGDMGSTVPASNKFGFDWRRILAAALVGGLLALIGGLFQRRKNAQSH